MSKPKTADELMQEEKKTEERDRLKDLIRARVQEYELLGEYSGGPRSGKLKIRRWSYGLAVSLSPKVVVIGKDILTMVQTFQGGEEKDFKVLLGQHLADIGQIVAITLLAEKDANGFKTDEDALAFVMELDPLEIWDIGKIIYTQNFEYFLKNRMGGLVPKAQ